MITINIDPTINVLPERKYSLEELKMILGVCRKTAGKIVRTNVISSIKVGKRKKYLGRAIRSFLEGLTRDPEFIAITKTVE